MAKTTYKCDVCGMELERKSLKTNRGMMEFPCHAGTEDVHGVMECQAGHIIKLKARIAELGTLCREAGAMLGDYRDLIETEHGEAVASRICDYLIVKLEEKS